MLTALRERGAMSRAELARYAGVAPSTISGVVQELVTDGVVVGSGGQRGGPPGRSSRLVTGRPGLRLTLNPGFGAVAGVEFGFRRLRVLLCDLAHDIIGSGECDLPDGHTSAAGLAIARRLLDETLAGAGLSHGALIGAGVSLPGPIRHHPDVVKPSGVLPGWHGATGHDIEQALGVPVSIDNDANLAALGEHVWGTPGLGVRRLRHGQVPLRHRERAVRERHPGARRPVGAGGDGSYHRRRARPALPLRQARLPGHLRRHPGDPGRAGTAARQAGAGRPHAAAGGA